MCLWENKSRVRTWVGRGSKELGNAIRSLSRVHKGSLQVREIVLVLCVNIMLCIPPFVYAWNLLLRFVRNKAFIDSNVICVDSDIMLEATAWRPTRMHRHEQLSHCMLLNCIGELLLGIHYCRQPS
jgi:hypothetical protein